MVTARRFWYNLFGATVVVLMQFVVLGLFFRGYMPTFANQPIDQKITIVVSLVTAAVFFVGEIAVIVSSIRYERPSRQRQLGVPSQPGDAEVVA
jgi:L-cystine uptake protein TcyP (sodium:dicarboxylate symporter family)